MIVEGHMVCRAKTIIKTEPDYSPCQTFWLYQTLKVEKGGISRFLEMHPVMCQYMYCSLHALIVNMPCRYSKYRIIAFVLLFLTVISFLYVHHTNIDLKYGRFFSFRGFRSIRVLLFEAEASNFSETAPCLSISLPRDGK